MPPRFFYAIVRGLHLYVGLFLSPFVVVFSVSVIFLVHAWLPGTGAPPSNRTAANVPLPSNLEQLKGREQLAALHTVLDAIDVQGEIGFVRLLPKQRRFVIPVAVPGRETVVEIDVAAATAAYVGREYTPDDGKNQPTKIASADEALAGARDILAERISDDKDARTRLRALFQKDAVISSKVLTGAEIANLKLAHEDLWDVGSTLGSGGMIVIAEGTCMVRLMQILMRFYHHESCGQCTPCRHGTGWMHRIVDRIIAGEGRPEDIERLYYISKYNDGTTICGLGDAAGYACTGILDKFRAEFEYYIEHKRSRHDGNLECLRSP